MSFARALAYILRPDVEGAQRIGRIRQHVVVREHHAFRAAGGARGVDDTREP